MHNTDEIILEKNIYFVFAKTFIIPSDGPVNALSNILIKNMYKYLLISIYLTVYNKVII
jgi:hypothetical protein